MLVYGDGTRRERPAAMLAGIREALATAESLEGIARHGWLVAALIEAGELAQGVADAGFRAHDDHDAPDAEADRAMRLAVALARRVLASWDARFAASGGTGETEAALAALDDAALPGTLDVRLPEGFAHYAVYPEGFAEAARMLPPAAEYRSVGIRSIGTTLAAIVATALPGAAAPITLRPVGPPFGRRVAATPDLGGLLGRDGPDWQAGHASGPARFVVADEGPGLSGSSIAAVGAYLAGLGVPAERLHVLPSHGGDPGPEADAASRAFWAGADRRVVPFDDLILRSRDPARRPDAWFADLLGPPTGPLREVTGGLWRAERGLGEAPVHPWAEARKFLLPAASGPVLLRFAGLGRLGLRRFAMARRLHEAGFVPEPFAWRHGFTAERWRADARPLDILSDRPALLTRLGAYLGFRALTFPVPAGSGASAASLLGMLRHNGRGLAGTARLAESWAGRVDALERRRRPVATDNRLHAWEWLATPDGLLKADATDHHAGHDLIGPQDVAWDVAGACAEFDLSGGERDALAETVGAAAGRPVDPELVAFMRPCYLAFQHGSFVMAARAGAAGPERERLERTARRYRDALAAVR